VACTIIDSSFPADGSCDCPGIGLDDAAEPLRTSVVEYLRNNAICDTTGTPACAGACTCTLRQLSGDDLAQCLAGNDDPSTPGFCYIDPAQGVGSDAAVAACPSSNKRLIHFVGDNVPPNGTTAVLACDAP
jgi:hypothetical protein